MGDTYREIKAVISWTAPIERVAWAALPWLVFGSGVVVGLLL